MRSTMNGSDESRKRFDKPRSVASSMAGGSSGADGPIRAREFDRSLFFILPALVLLRGIVVLCILPPLGAWDEDQHIAYVDHINRTGRAPELGRAVLADSLVDRIVELPHARQQLIQVGRLGAIDYRSYWEKRERGDKPSERKPGTIELYEAQHGSFYYFLSAPLYRLAGGADSLKNAVGLLRFVDVLLTAASIVVIAWGVKSVVRDGRVASWIAIVAALQPMFLLNGARVANDALGVFLASIAIVLCLTIPRSPTLVRCLLIGIFMGLAVRAKAIHWALLPFVSFAFVAAIYRSRAGFKSTLICGFVLSAAIVATTGDEVASNLRRFGGPTAMQEAVVNRAAGRGIGDQIATARSIDWLKVIENHWFRDNLLIAGWEYYQPGPRIKRIYEWSLLLGLACRLAAIVANGSAAGRRRRAEKRGRDSSRNSEIMRSDETQPIESNINKVACNQFDSKLDRGDIGGSILVSKHVPLACFILVLSYMLALAYHTVQSKLAWGRSTTNVWYGAAAIPWLLLLVVSGAAIGVGSARRFAGLISAALVATFAVAESTIILGWMSIGYSAGARGVESFRRLAELQPAWLGFPTFCCAISLILILYSVMILRFQSPFERDRSGDESDSSDSKANRINIYYKHMRFRFHSAGRGRERIDSRRVELGDSANPGAASNVQSYIIATDSMNRDRRGDRVRRDRFILAFGAFAFMLIQAIAGVWLREDPRIADREFGIKLELLRARIAERPRSPLVVALGTSRMATGFDPAATPLRSESNFNDRDPLFFNASLVGSCPEVMNLTLARLLARGIHPEIAVIEFWPPFFGYERGVRDYLDQTNPGALTYRQARTTARLLRKPERFMKLWYQYQAVPLYYNRYSILESVWPGWFPPPDRPELRLRSIAATGWWKPHDSVDPAEARRLTDQYKLKYEKELSSLSIKPQSDRALREIIAQCRKNKIRPLIVYLPEGREFQGWYSSASRSAIERYLDDLEATERVEIVDARDWAADETFLDGHHLLPPGARMFSQRLIGEIVTPILAGSPIPRRGALARRDRDRPR